MTNDRSSSSRGDVPATRAILYTRCSTAEQADSGLGLAAQEAALTAECERRGWLITAVRSDAGASGRSLTGRPALASALGMLDTGDADCLMVAKLDRLSRSLLDFAGLMAKAQRDGWNLVALDLGIDLATPAGEFMASVMASAAQWERRIIGQRTKDALAVRRAQGQRLGRPPVVSAEVRAAICASRVEGRSLRAIAEELNDAGVPTAHGGARWHPATIRAILLGQDATTTPKVDPPASAPCDRDNLSTHHTGEGYDG